MVVCLIVLHCWRHHWYLLSSVDLYTYCIVCFVVKVTSAEIESIGRNVKQDMGYLTQRPIYFHWRSDVVLEVFAADDDSTSAVNLKKGIAALFQVQSLEGDFIEVE